MDPADPESLLPGAVPDLVRSLGVAVLDSPRGVWRGGEVVSHQEIPEG